MAEVKPRRAFGDDSGAELIELAIVLPMLLLVFAAIVDFGFLFQRYEVLTNAAREGARLGVLDGYVEADVDARVASYLTASGLDVTGDPTTVTYSTEELTPGGKTINVITVTVEYPATFSTITPIAAMVTGGSGFSTLTLRASSTMRTEVVVAGS